MQIRSTFVPSLTSAVALHSADWIRRHNIFFFYFLYALKGLDRDAAEALSLFQRVSRSA